jgi:hypothetical protein
MTPVGPQNPDTTPPDSLICSYGPMAPFAAAAASFSSKSAGSTHRDGPPPIPPVI